MDDIKPSRSLDGMQGPSNQPSAPQSGGLNSAPANTGGLNQFNDADYAPENSLPEQQPTEQQHFDPPQQSGGSGKGLKVALTIFVILFIAASAAAGWFYMQSAKEPEPVTATVDVTRIQQENESLTYDNKTLKTQNTQLQVQVKSLNTTAQQLKSKCGSSCSGITIPQ